MFAKLESAIVVGIDAHIVQIEVDSSRGLPAINIIGLAQGAAKESKDRAVHALVNSGIRIPPKKIIINLAPADLKKGGSGFDLPIALGLSIISGVNIDTKGYIFAAELSLDGNLRGVSGIFPIAVFARENNLNLIVSKDNEDEVAISGAKTAGFKALSDVISFLQNKEKISYKSIDINNFYSNQNSSDMDFIDVKGQIKVKRAAQIAASGFHNILFIGPPGVGKSMIAKRITTIIPRMNENEILETTKIYSVTGLLDKDNPVVIKRPFRAPHHTASDVSLIGGGINATPGEITLANNGILFLDEFPEFKRNVLEVLRQPMEDGSITVSRASAKNTYPAHFLLIAAMNPCPCGYYGSKKKECSCTISQIKKYRQKISGPILDRIDIQISVPEIDYKEMTNDSYPQTSSKKMRNVVEKAVDIQKIRFKKNKSVNYNSQMSEKDLKRYCILDEESNKILQLAMDKFAFSARSYSKILKIARTIADMDNQDKIKSKHIKEAISYRILDWDV